MAWTASNLSAAAVDALCNGTFYVTGTWTADTINCALYGTAPTPNKNDTLANNTYNAGQWVSTGTNQETTGTGYSAGGQALGTKTHTFGSGTSQLGAAGPVWTSATISGVFGCLVYDNTNSPKYAYCWNWFGGTQSVSGGSFTIVWSGAGILQFTIV
jgi:hypothetical protein